MPVKKGDQEDTSSAQSTTSTDALVRELIQSNISLEKVSVELLDNMSKLGERIDRMFGLFEEAAKKIEEGEILQQPLAKQLQDLIEQNRTIARGLLVLERYIRERSAGIPSSEFKELPKTI